VRKVIIDVGASLVAKSPVGDGSLWKHPPPKGYVGGRFRANWQHGFNVMPSGTKSDIDPSGQVSIEAIQSRLGSVEKGAFGVHYIVNNLPYARVLEHGHSTQAPSGMVGLTVTEFESIVGKAVSDVK
jgi:hypothetical protein